MPDRHHLTPALLALLLHACAGVTATPAATPQVNSPAPGGATPVIPSVLLGEPFRLAYDRLVRVADTGVSLRFAELLEDSRCPPGVQCIQAGHLRVRLELSPPTGAVESLELSTDADRNRGSAAGLTLELQDAEPAPAIVKRAQRPDHYTLTLVATRGGG
ncbi:MAG TPA: hypothetical protein VGV61_04485 [Thermoanaerobaculia bacterium]|jgi:hypothetical protein|nr:hypothetical protein [Thermoanaerobaculia bacterium]